MITTTQEYKIGDCLELLPSIETKSINLVISDLPYGTTACDWDTQIDLDKLWPEYKRIITDNGVIVLTASQPFTSKLVMSNLKMFKYEWIWEKDNASNFATGKYVPLKYHENICIFGNDKSKYNPQMKKTNKKSNVGGKSLKWKSRDNIFGVHNKTIKSTNRNSYDKYPSTIQKFNKPKHNSSDIIIHPTQKPVALFEYLIKTYTNPGDTVHDSCLGSGTTLEACKNTNRNCIGFEISDQWIPYYKQRLNPNKYNVDKESKLTENQSLMKYFRKE
ncbi:MAG: site-specific DNA-methyltransferase [Candidatus Aenigmarchaeota archaeon]|nr:site-specific DNA-methyltransferase [Candidatus Aenigmarchaeota archaeon]